MRISTRLGVLGVFFGCLALTGTASAAGGGGATQAGKGSAEGRGGAGPGGAPGGGGGSTSGVGPSEGRNPDVVRSDVVAKKPWEVGGTWETHRLIRQNDVNNSSKNLNVLGAYAQYDITQYDRVKVRAFLYQRFIADDGETGFRFDDMIFQYTRTIPLPQKFTAHATGWVTAPTSFASQKQGLITAPRLALDLSKQFGEYVTAGVRTSGDALIYKYRTSEGGNYNPKYALRFGADVEVVMPFHKALSIGAGAGTGYTWYYEPNSTNDPNPQVQRLGVTGDPYYSTQPIGQTYSGEIFVRYILPNIIGVKSDIVIAAADGDPSLGSVSVLHDGVAHFYPGYRQTAEVYGTLAIRY